MKRFLLSFFLALLSALAHGDDNTGESATDEKPVAGESIRNERTLSPAVTEAIKGGIKYAPPKSEEELVDLRDVDKPRNQIIRLPKFVVEAKRPPVFNERNLYSKEMLRRLAYQRYVSAFSRNVLNRFRLPLIGGGIDAYASLMYEDEEREMNMAEIDDRVAMYRVSGDDAAARTLNDEAQRTFMRRSGFGLPVRKQP
jgi:hypothetical protein